MQIDRLDLDHLEELQLWWMGSQRLHPMTRDLLTRRLFAAPDADPELMLAVRDGDGRMAGMACAGRPRPAKEGSPESGVRWLGASPGEGADAVAASLLEELEPRLRRQGARRARLMATPPYYLRPGVDMRETGLIAALLDMGWRHSQTHFNMTVRLAAVDLRANSTLNGLESAGYRLRRADPDDTHRTREFMDAHWGAEWRDEVMLAFDEDPITLFLAEQGDTLVGFAAYEVNQCLGSFGPTGVLPEHRGKGLGRRLLRACLADLRHRGRAVCEIGWVGPVAYYHRICAAELGPCYLVFEKDLGD